MKKFFLFFLISLVVFPKDKIVMVNSYSKDYIWTYEQEEFFKTNLGKNYDYQSFYMDSRRIKESEFQNISKLILQEIKTIKPKLVYITDDNALKYIGAFIDSSIPIVYSGINNSLRTEYPWILERKNVFGLSERPLIFRTITTISEKLNLKNSKILILLGDDSTGKGMFEFDLGSRSSMKLKNLGEIYVIKNKNFEEWKKIILDSQNKGFTFILPLSNYALVDKNSNPLDYSEVMGWINKNSQVPLFTIHEDQIGPNMATGGVILRGKFFGEEAGKMAKQFLSGNTNIKSKTLDTGDIVFSISELEKQNFRINLTDSSVKFIK